MSKKQRIGIFRESVSKYAPSAFANQFPSIHECISSEDIPHKEKIVSYLRAGDIDIATTAPAWDVLPDKELSFAGVGMSDEMYEWGAVLPYYIETYNVALPNDVTEHILKKIGALAEIG